MLPFLYINSKKVGDIVKKILMILCALIIASSGCVAANTTKTDWENEYLIIINGAEVSTSALVDENICYVPLRIVFEQLGAKVFYRSSDRFILALSRDGDMIYHQIESNRITLNGEEKIFKNPSVLKNGQTYIPVEMITAAFCPDFITHENQQVNIQKYFFHNDYHKIIQEITAVSQLGNFNPEKFQRYVNYHVKMPTYSVQEVVFRVNLDLDYPFYENIAIIEQPYELSVLVNKHHQLPTDFTQYNLVNMARGYTANDGKEYLLAGVAYEKYAQMADAAKSDGVSMKVVSAYRTESYQRGLYNNKLRSTGKTNADRYSARPGHSEHQTGLAVDINSTYVSFENSVAFQWLTQHAHEYGFILRYPKGKEWITGYAYEPWHYRYVGVDAATIIAEEGITYEEYYVKYVHINEFQ